MHISILFVDRYSDAFVSQNSSVVRIVVYSQILNLNLFFETDSIFEKIANQIQSKKE
jgi:hypothetical protein